jgi:formylglycine-generating enzyme required for sulfatase activity/tRNA A-37 threonylcarbamoyl transferase component Bud32
MTDSMHTGRVIGGDFRVIRCLRAGGMGSVYHVEQLSTGAERALKVMRADLVGDEPTRQRFLLEARIGARIESDHVVDVVTAGIDPDLGVPYLVMELLKGEDLAERVERLGRLPIADVSEILAQLGHALGRAHALGIVHRDLKPENVFVAGARRRDTPFTVKILDFGIAKLVGERQNRATQSLGTPLYMAPEQAEAAGHITPASDVWSLGLAAFFMLAGRDFWRNTDAALSALLSEILVEPIPSASQRASELGAGDSLPPGFDAWFARCVTRDPAARFAEAGAAVSAFARLLASPAWSTPPPTAVESRARPPRGVPWIASAVVALAALGGAITIGLALRARRVRSAPAAAVAVQKPVLEPTRPAPACPAGMVEVQGGTMFMGEQAGPASARPPHKVHVSSFCLDVTETTARAYDRCVASGNCLRAPRDAYYPGITAPARDSLGQLCNADRPGRGKYPINCVDWSMANNFCHTRGGRLNNGGARLPTEAEWEFAARGSSQRTYPWGDEPPGPTRLNACGSECVSWTERHLHRAVSSLFGGSDGYAGTAPVGSFPAGASKDGIMDLAGNVWEWTADWYAPYTSADQSDPHGPATGTERVVRGGGYNGSEADWIKPAYRWKTVPGAYNPAIGFRCAMTAASN